MKTYRLTFGTEKDKTVVIDQAETLGKCIEIFVNSGWLLSALTDVEEEKK